LDIVIKSIALRRRGLLGDEEINTDMLILATALYKGLHIYYEVLTLKKEDNLLLTVC
jgi:hypothetical protein